MRSKRDHAKKSPGRQKKAKVSTEIAANNGQDGHIPRLEMQTGLVEVEQKRMMVFVRHIL